MCIGFTFTPVCLFALFVWLRVPVCQTCSSTVMSLLNGSVTPGCQTKCVRWGVLCIDLFSMRSLNCFGLNSCFYFIFLRSAAPTSLLTLPSPSCLVSNSRLCTSSVCPSCLSCSPLSLRVLRCRRGWTEPPRASKDPGTSWTPPRVSVHLSQELLQLSQFDDILFQTFIFIFIFNTDFLFCYSHNMITQRA